MFTCFRPSRVCLVLIALLALPVLTYWDTIFAHFGLRDDYSVLREAHEEPGKITAFCASHARPVFGWFLEQSFQPLHQIEDLKWARLLAALCVGLSAAGTTWVLVRRFDWRLGTAAGVGALVALLPASQVLVGWAICWGHLMGVIFAIAAFALADRGVRGSAGWRRAGWLLGGWSMLLLAALTYQSNALFYVVFLAAGLPGQRAWSVRERITWIGGHLAMVGSSLFGAFLTAKGLFATGIFAQSDRIAFEPDILGKIGWFFHGPLGNALSLLVINDDDGRTIWWHWLAAGVVGLIIAAGLVLERRRYGLTACFFWGVGLVGLPLLAYSVSIIASERWSTYRTIYALTGVLLVFFVHGLDHLAARTGRGGARWFTPVVLGALVIVGFGLARHQAYDLIAVPQARELRLMAESARLIEPEKHPRVFLVTPDPDESFAELTYADEFGSLSTASTWTPKEMLKHLMSERYPNMTDVNARYTFDYGDVRPTDGTFDVVIDLNQALLTLKERQLGKRGTHPSAWRYFAAWRSFGLERGLRSWPVLVLLGFALVLLGRRFTDREPGAA